MERGLLSAPELAAHYDDVVWFYLFQDFSKSPADRAAERLAIRFGISSWPQHFLVDPHNLTKLADTGRSLPTFAAAVAAAKVRSGPADPTPKELAALDALAQKLEDGGEVKLAKQHLHHTDRVIACRALQLLAERAPDAIVADAGRLLAVPNDQIRGIVCDLLAKHGSTAIRDVLHGLVERPAPSENPNVLRIRAVTALARCGDESTVALLGPLANGPANNGLTTTAIRTLAALGAREPKARPAAVRVLVAAFPAPAAGTDAAAARMQIGVAKAVHQALQELTGKQVPFPETWDEAARRKLAKAW